MEENINITDETNCKTGRLEETCSSKRTGGLENYPPPCFTAIVSVNTEF